MNHEQRITRAEAQIARIAMRDCRRVLSALIAALEECVRAMEQSQAVGCTDHLDAWDDAPQIWYEPLERAKALLGRIEE